MNNLIDKNSSLVELQELLAFKGWLKEAEVVEKVGKAGEGNMNVVLRLKTNQRSFIIKQSRPFVYKYQEISAPIERIITEQKFYRSLSNSHVKQHFPALLNSDKEDYLIMLSDIGDVEDLTNIYNAKKVSQSLLEELVLILEGIHYMRIKKFPSNLELRVLNHQHIFVLPYKENNGFDLDQIQPLLGDLSIKYKSNEQLIKQVAQLGEDYLKKGDTLIHGDYYPGSWLERDRFTYVIDPEFSFLGFSEFDLGVMAAHIVMATSDRNYTEVIFDMYSLPFKKKLARQIVGVEVIRRIIGLAQIPLTMSISDKEALLDWAVELILD